MIVTSSDLFKDFVEQSDVPTIETVRKVVS